MITKTDLLDGGHADETIERIRKTIIEKGVRPPSWKGKFHSEETKAKMSISGKKYTKTKEHCEKISKAKKGIPSKRKGTRCSEETRLRMSIAAKLRVMPKRGPLSEETKMKISETLKNKALLKNK